MSLRMRQRESNRLWKYVRLRQTEEEMSFSMQRSADSLKYIIKSAVVRTGEGGGWVVRGGPV